MLRENELLVFCITIFIALTFIGPGMFISDELCTGNQLKHIVSGNQLTYYEQGDYGFYEDGTIDTAITNANYVMHYSLGLAVFSIPIYLIFNVIQSVSLIPLLFWAISGFIISYYISSYFKNNKYLSIIPLIIFSILLIFSIFTYRELSLQYIEIPSVVFTNIILLGLLSIIIYRICIFITENRYKSEFIWMCTISSTSLFFWAGTLKDHVLSSLLFLIFIYEIIQFYNKDDVRNISIAGISLGLLIWIRPELSIFTTLIATLIILFKYRSYFVKPLACFYAFLIIGILPLFINNYIVTGSFFKFPFQLTTSLLGTHISTNAIEILTKEIPFFGISAISKITLSNIFGIFASPANMSIGLLAVIAIPIITLLSLPYIYLYRKSSISSSEWIMILFSIGIFCTYFFGSFLSFDLHREVGIVPDLRYFAPAYAPLIISSMIILTREFKLNYKTIFTNILMFTPIIITIILAGIIISGDISNLTWKDIGKITNIFAILVSGIYIFTYIQSLRFNKPYIEKPIAAIISLIISWQFLSMLSVHKLYMYVPFSPIGELLRKFIFGF